MRILSLLLVVLGLFLVPVFGDSPDELKTQYKALQDDIARQDRVAKYADEVLNPQSMVQETDRDPLDIVLRRTKALLDDLKDTTPKIKLGPLEAELARLKKTAKGVDPSKELERYWLYEKVCVVRRKIAFANPLLDFDKLVFIKKHRATYSHMCDQYYGINSKPGGGVFVLSDPFGDSPKVKDILADSVVEKGKLKGQKLVDGSFVSPDLSYDGKELLFAFVECKGSTDQIFHNDHAARGHWDEQRCFHVFKTNIDGSGLTQMTEGTWNDFDPVYLPNGRVGFITERRGGYLRCGRECPTFTLYDMKDDGSDIRCLSPHETNEWHPSVTNDGMIIYTRWDYVDRHGCTAHQPWITSPDGRDSRAVHGNFAPRRSRPDMELDVRAIPGSRKFISIAAPHHGHSFGTVVMIDPQVVDDDAMAPVKRMTPEIGFPESQGGRWGVYATPWPLSEKYYLCVYAAPGGKKRYAGKKHGIYLVDVYGNKELIYRDDEISAQSPMPLRARKAPPIIPDKSIRVADTSKATGTMAVINVYDTLKPWDESIKITDLRIYQIIPMSVPSGKPPHETALREPTSTDSVVLARYVLGTVPVEKDGSAHFVVPADKELFFQALDKDGLAIQSMRSATYVKPGEKLVCQGCHEPKQRAPQAMKSIPLAMRRGPSKPKPDVDGTNPFSYPRLVQPVLEKNCLGCHKKHPDKAPRLDREVITGGNRHVQRNQKWYASYHSLIKYAFTSYGNPVRTTPGKFGARASKLYEMLKKGHHDVKLSQEDMHRITVWLDSCSIFYGVYEKEGGEAQLRGEVVYPTLE